MKSLLLLLLFSTACYAQYTTESYNTNLKRYEYRDAYGTLTDIKSWDSYNRVWVYTQVAQQYNAYNTPPRDYGKVTDVSAIDLMGQVATIKQGRYDNNRDKVQEYINHLFDNLNASNVDPLIKVRAKYRFDLEVLKPISNEGGDLSKNSEANRMMNALREGATRIINEEVSNFVPLISNQTRNVEFIIEYKNVNGNWVKTKVDKTPTQIKIENGNHILFKKGKEAWKDRWLKYSCNDESLNLYICNSPYGDVCVGKDFEVVIFFDPAKLNKYVYAIKQ